MHDETITFCDEELDREEPHAGEARPISDVLAELLAEYRARFPEIHLTLVEAPSAL